MKCISGVGVLAMLSTFALGQVAPAPNPPVVKHVPISKTSSSSGKEMFKTHCAVCHGLDGTGTGPATPAMETNPTDLTALAQKSGGKYPASYVAAVIGGQAETPSHRRRDMPAWGPFLEYRSGPRSPGSAANYEPR